MDSERRAALVVVADFLLSRKPLKVAGQHQGLLLSLLTVVPGWRIRFFLLSIFISWTNLSVFHFLVLADESKCTDFHAMLAAFDALLGDALICRLLSWPPEASFLRQ